MDTRLKKQKDFDLVFKKGTRVFSKSLTLLYIKADSLKIGISLSKKHGKAVVRNKVKRLIRAVVRNYVNTINDSYYIVVLPKVADKYDYFVFLKDLEYTLKKGKLING